MNEKYLSFLQGVASSLYLALAITLAVELLIALLWRRIKGRDIFLVLIINFITNPIANAIIYGCRFYMPLTSVKIIEYSLEVVVLLSEWLYYRKYMSDFKHPFLLSLTANAASYGAGLLYMVLR